MLGERRLLTGIDCSRHRIAPPNNGAYYYVYSRLILFRWRCRNNNTLKSPVTELMEEGDTHQFPIRGSGASHRLFCAMVGGEWGALGPMLTKPSGRQSLSHSTRSLTKSSSLHTGKATFTVSWWIHAERAQWWVLAPGHGPRVHGHWSHTGVIDVKTAQPTGNWMQGSSVSDPGVFAQFSATVW